MSDNFSLLIKPASADCNLHCRYCFYLGKHALYPETGKHRMNEATLQRLLKSYLSTPQQVYSVTWQGGEPALMGLEFYKMAVELQKRYASRGSRMMNCLQTNATLINAEVAAFMGRYRFLTGCSLDGPAAVHDVYRRSPSGRPTHARVINGIRMLSGYGVPVNAVCLVSTANVDRPLEIYEYFKSIGFDYIQFIPCVEHDIEGNPHPWSLTGPEWGYFLSKVFDRWYARDVGKISVRNFESVLARLVTGSAAECHMQGRCDRYLVVEYNGDVYPCDFFVRPENKLGNIHENSFAEIRASQKYKGFAGRKSALSGACAECAYLRLCMGDCLKFRRKTAHGGDISVLCAGWKQFFGATMERFEKMAATISSG